MSSDRVHVCSGVRAFAAGMKLNYLLCRSDFRNLMHFFYL